MKRILCLALVFNASMSWAGTIFVEYFNASPNPVNVSGSLPLNTWHLDGDTTWQKEGSSGENTVTTVSISGVMDKGLQLGWGNDNVEVRYVLNDNWDLSREYTLTGVWAKKGDASTAVSPWHLGFHVYLSEYASTHLVQHVKKLHVAPGNPAVNTTGSFSITVTPAQLQALGVDTDNYIGITFVRSEDELLHTDDGGWDRQNDIYMVDNLVLQDNASSAQAIITQPVYLSASGDNSNDGLSPTTAWRDVDALDTRGFGPGAQILFNRGDTFPGACELLAKGSTTNPVLISAYGTGAKPHLTGGPDHQAVFYLSSAEYLEFRDLQISNNDTNNISIPYRYGVRLEALVDLGELDHIYFDQIDFSDLRGSADTVDQKEENIAIYAIGYDNGDATAFVPTYWNDLQVTGCTFSNLFGRGIRINDYCQELGQGVGSTPPATYAPTTGFVCRNNYALNCDFGLLMFRGLKDALVEYNTVDGTTLDSGVWIFGSEGSLVQYNVFKRIRRPNADGAACHIDYNCKDSIMQYNFGYETEGALISIFVNSDYDFFQENAIARYNVGIDCGLRDSIQGAGIFLSGRITNCKVYNNTIIQLNKPVKYGISIGNWGGEWPNNNAIYNNVFYAATYAPTYNEIGRMAMAGNVLSHNLYYGLISPPAQDLNPFTGNPMFVDPTGLAGEPVPVGSPEDFAGDFRVTYGSAAISNGLLMADNGGLDYFGNPVASNALPTLGAHEYLYDPLIDSDGDKMPDHWEVGYALNPVDPADALIHSDSDDLLNLSEYAFGGDPQDGGDAGHPVNYSVSGSDMIYVYPRRTVSTIAYGLETSDNLVSNWVAGGYAEIGAGSLDAEFESVTNAVPMDGDTGFVRLFVD